MTKKDYNLIVEALGSGLNRAAFEHEDLTGDQEAFKGRDLYIARLTARGIGKALAARLAEDNPRFNREKFMDAINEAVGEVEVP